MGERQTEDLKASCSIHEGRIFLSLNGRDPRKFLLQILSHIVMSFEFQLVGKLSPPVQLETLCLLLPGYCSGAKSIESPNAPAEDFQRESESEAYLNEIQAGEWKRHDHYKILRLGHLRMAATDDAIKQAYRKMILLH